VGGHPGHSVFVWNEMDRIEHLSPLPTSQTIVPTRKRIKRSRRPYRFELGTETHRSDPHWAIHVYTPVLAALANGRVR
jgi:hypothetical protein